MGLLIRKDGFLTGVCSNGFFVFSFPASDSIRQQEVQPACVEAKGYTV